MSLPTEPIHWTRGEFLISTDKRYLLPTAINHAFVQDYMYWASPFPQDTLKKIIENSFCFGVYDLRSQRLCDDENGHPQRPVGDLNAADVKQIGFARLVTDGVTFAYLTDLYVLPEYQGQGLGGWLIDCVDEVVRPLPYLRWLMLRTSAAKSQASYEARLGMKVLDTGDVSEGPVMMGRQGTAGGV
ncbi:putative GNAT family N-acetyltransferase [Aspergillus uvarum CBS 121591]|uniref:Putative GNAT family N-acetyltransferase n=1 Tax=Aspergillus uvarum CBS 121591 TaxID=1448315 RepID=A0A319CNH7_9EURO|nr:putative GNAT family N-acetyltransferase [Aspergillus uvarum CBS 121591]PYH86724.1 putative GNAT family N-acetyltransferase [Aspergillus uvarum CBS 121591]